MRRDEDVTPRGVSASSVGSVMYLELPEWEKGKQETDGGAEREPAGGGGAQLTRFPPGLQRTHRPPRGSQLEKQGQSTQERTVL